MLDCTLRDGGYCNECNFGYENIKKIIESLIESNLDIIECGFLSNKVSYNKNITKYSEIKHFSSVIPKNRCGKMFVALMNLGEYDPEKLPEYDGTSIDGIRVAFHKKDLIEALKVCKRIKEKGYKVFIQGMVSLNYKDEEFIDLIRRVNALEPYAFYIVDSFGQMKKKDLVRLLYIVEHNLNDTIKIGFHSHNNMQLAYSNAQSLIDFHTKRNLIIDSSVYGMGRGAGNLNTELFVEYLNDNADGEYNLKPLLSIIDEILNDFYQKNYWGYSLPNYLSAVHGVHPNYAAYLDDKKTLTVEDMNEIFDMMVEDKKNSFDKSYAEKLYIRHMATGKVQEEHLTEIESILAEKTVVLIAPGKSADTEREKIIKAMLEENVISISVNFDYQEAETDFIFLSNLRRYRALELEKRSKCIVTSNIPSNQTYLQVKYSELLNGMDFVSDNAGLMAINFLIKHGVKKIRLAGFDGYSHDIGENYIDSQKSLVTRNEMMDLINVGMIELIKKYNEQIEIEFLTKPRQVIIE